MKDSDLHNYINEKKNQTSRLYIHVAHRLSSRLTLYMFMFFLRINQDLSLTFVFVLTLIFKNRFNNLKT